MTTTSIQDHMYRFKFLVLKVHASKKLAFREYLKNKREKNPSYEVLFVGIMMFVGFTQKNLNNSKGRTTEIFYVKLNTFLRH